MIKKNSFCILGGDMRQIFLYKSLVNDGHNVKIYGFSEKKVNFNINFEKNISSALKESDFVILPVPVTRSGNTLYAPFSELEIFLDDNMAEKIKDKKIFCGAAKKVKKLSEKWQNLALKDYSLREDFSILNAVPTAEGAIKIAIEELEGTIDSSKILVVGFGKIGKVLCKLLKNLGADVTASARSEADIAWIQALGYKSTKTNELPNKLSFDLIFNTVPAMVFSRSNLLKCSPNAKIIDLASMPGGVDFKTAELLGLKAIHALGLPGRFSPKAAGEIIKKTIYTMLKEENYG